MASPSVHQFVKKCSFTASRVPLNTILLDCAAPACASFFFNGLVSASMIRSRVFSAKHLFIVSTESRLIVLGYSACRRSGTPSALPVLVTRSRKLVAATVTEGMPSFSASMAGRAAAGVHVPQAPFPVITASQPFAFSSARKTSNVFSFFSG